MDRGFKSFFRRINNGETPGFPRFKNRKRYNSIEALRDYNYIRDKKVFVFGIGEIPARSSKHCWLAEGKQKLLRVIKKSKGWFAQVMIDDCKELPIKKEVKKQCGIDVGIKTFATLDDGSVIENPKFIKKFEKKIGAVQAALAKKVHGSKNRKKVINKLSWLNERLKNCRTNFLHQESRKLVNEYDLISVEDLDITQMVEKKPGLTPKERRIEKLSHKYTHDASWGQFRNYLTYKAEWAGKEVVAINPAYTSQECSNCGVIVRKKITQRRHECPCCGMNIDRDHNAAINILFRAVGSDQRLLTQLGPF